MQEPLRVVISPRCEVERSIRPNCGVFLVAKIVQVFVVVVVGVLGVASFLQSDAGGCGNVVACTQLSVNDVHDVSGLRLPLGSAIVGGSSVHRNFFNRYNYDLDVEVHVPKDIDAYLLARHFAVIPGPAKGLELPSDHSQWTAAKRQFGDIRYFTNQTYEGENPGTYVLVGVAPDGRVAIVVDFAEDL